MDPSSETVEIPQRVSKIVGTSAKLQRGDTLTVEELFYGLMLPSGNDAGYVLAQHFGEKLISENILREDEENGVKLIEVKSTFTWSTRVKVFLQEMNFYANKLGMLNTVYDSPHGLDNPFNISSAADQGLLISHCFSEPMFRKIINTKKYICQSRIQTYTWNNTNKLLHKGYLGVKTGVTESAGP